MLLLQNSPLCEPSSFNRGNFRTNDANALLNINKGNLQAAVGSFQSTIDAVEFFSRHGCRRHGACVSLLSFQNT